MQATKEVELGFFGCLLSYEGLGITLNISKAFQEGANAGWFADERCQLMWAAVESLWKQGVVSDKPVAISFIMEAKRLASDKKSPYAKVQIGPEFLEDAHHYGKSLADISAYAKELRNSSIERKITERISKLTSTFGQEADAGHVGSALAQDIQKIIQSESNVQELSMSDITTRIVSTFDTSYEQYVVKGNYDYVPGLPLPWRPVSRRIKGLQGGLIFIAARPSVGKTSFALSILEFLANKGYHCAFNCLDMAAVQILQRPISTLSKIPLNDLNGGVREYPKLRERVLKAKEQIDSWDVNGNFKCLHLNDVDKLKSWCIARRSMGQLDIVVIDYIQQLQAKGRFANKNAELEYISAQLKDLATQYDMPVVVLSQLSRDNVKDKDGEREPTMADLRGSGALEQDAFMIMMLYQDTGTMNKWSQDLPPMGLVMDGEQKSRKTLKPVWCKIEKAQNGELGKFPFVVQQDIFEWRLGDYTSDEQGPSGSKHSPKFEKIVEDGRDPAFEKYADGCGSLIRLAACKEREDARADDFHADVPAAQQTSFDDDQVDELGKPHHAKIRQLPTVAQKPQVEKKKDEMPPPEQESVDVNDLSCL